MNQYSINNEIEFFLKDSIKFGKIIKLNANTYKVIVAELREITRVHYPEPCQDSYKATYELNYEDPKCKVRNIKPSMIYNLYDGAEISHHNDGYN